MTGHASDAADFWRYANGVKFSAAVSAIENFSTRGSVSESLSRLFVAMGKELAVLVKSERQFHLFPNPDLQQVHLLECRTEAMYEELKVVEFRYHFDPADRLKWSLYTCHGRFASGEPLGTVIYGSPPFPLCEKLHGWLGSPRHIALAPFCKGDTPFGYFLFCWYEDAIPTLFQNSEEGTRWREGAISVLDYLHRLVTRLVSNHYPIHRDTYVPSFQTAGRQSVCVLFADIRNFTSAFETSRLVCLERQRYPELLIGFVKAYLRAASMIIAEPGIGRIDKFLGDGIMATFGEYVVASQEPDVVACLLALYSAVLLLDAFNTLHRCLLDHPAFKGFRMQYNDVVNLRLGVGLNFGEVVFDYFGSPSGAASPESNLIGGYSEYTAVGDNVNVAQRLEGLASKPITQVSLLERAKERGDLSPNFVAPIVMGRTAFLRATDALQPIDVRDLPWEERYRSSFALRGKGSAVEAYEVFDTEINGSSLILKLQALVGKKLSEKIAASWRNGRFGFGENVARQLAERYFP